MSAVAQNRSTFSSFLRDFWLVEGGIPRRLFDEAGQRWKALEKTANTGWTGDGEIQFPSWSDLPAAGSADLATAWANSAPSGNEKWTVTRDQRWQVMQINWEVMELSEQQILAYLSARRAEQEAHMRRFQNLMSYFIYQNGGGAIARLKTGFTVAGANILELENPKCAKFFEAETRDGVGGDVIIFAGDDGTGSVGIRDTIYVVTQVNASSGKITVKLQGTTNTPVQTDVQDQDYIFFLGDYAKLFKGALAWTPVSDANLSTPFFGVTRDRRPERLAGTRVPYPPGTQPWTIFKESLTKAHELGLMIDRVTVPSVVWEQFEKDLKGEVASSQLRPASVNSDKATMRVGFTALEMLDARFSKPIMLYPDRYFEQPDLNAATNGGLWLFDYMGDEKFFMYPSGMSWKDYDGQGALKQIIGSQVLGANFGMFGQDVLKNTKNRLVAGPEGFVVES